MSVAHLQAMQRLEAEAFTYFGTSRPCALCGIPMVVHREHLASKVWTLVHGEQPVLCWKDEALGDELNIGMLRMDFAQAVCYAHWERYVD